MSIPTQEELFTSFRQAYKDAAVDPKMDRIFEDDYDWAVALCDREGVAAVRDAVLEGLAQEAHNELRLTGGANSVLAKWLRAHKVMP